MLMRVSRCNFVEKGVKGRWIRKGAFRGGVVNRVEDHKGVKESGERKVAIFHWKTPNIGSTN